MLNQNSVHSDVLVLHDLDFSLADGKIENLNCLKAVIYCFFSFHRE